MKHVMVIYGTRPEAIKMAPVVRALRASESVSPVVVVTGQHQRMLEDVNHLFGITPDIDLSLFHPGQSLNALASGLLRALDPVLDDYQPDAVLVQGDTTSVSMAAIAAFNHRIPVVHLEAGLRSGNLDSPFPEEANRRLTAQVTSLHLAPTASARQNLLNEGVDAEDVAVTGNTVIDALHLIARREVAWADPRLARLVSRGGRIVTVTAHRRENWGEPLHRIGRAVAQLAATHSDITFVLPLHANPLVRADVLPEVDGLDNVLPTEPLPYDQFAHLLSATSLVLSDSGGIQEEAPSLGIPVLVLRENTERPEALDAGTARLVGTDTTRIVDLASTLLDDPCAHAAMAHAVNPYGDGHATKRVVAAIEQLVGVGTRVPDFSPVMGVA